MVNLGPVQVSSDLSVPTEKIILVCLSISHQKKIARKEDWQLPNTT